MTTEDQRTLIMATYYTGHLEKEDGQRLAESIKNKMGKNAEKAYSASVLVGVKQIMAVMIITSHDMMGQLGSILSDEVRLAAYPESSLCDCGDSFNDIMYAGEQPVEVHYKFMALDRPIDEDTLLKLARALLISGRIQNEMRDFMENMVYMASICDDPEVMNPILVSLGAMNERLDELFHANGWLKEEEEEDGQREQQN